MTVPLNHQTQATKDQADKALDGLLDILVRTSDMAQKMLDQNKARRKRQEGTDE